jgi:hypothetical protein
MVSEADIVLLAHNMRRAILFDGIEDGFHHKTVSRYKFYNLSRRISATDEMIFYGLVYFRSRRVEKNHRVAVTRALRAMRLPGTWQTVVAVAAHIARQALDRSAIIGPVIRDRFRVATCDHNSAVRFDEVVAGQDFRDALILHLSALASIDRVYKIDVDELLFARACQRRWPCPKIDQIIRDLVQRA